MTASEYHKKSPRQRVGSNFFKWKTLYVPSPAIITCQLNEYSEGRQPSARTSYDDGSAWHLGGLIHLDLLLAGLPLLGRGRHLVPEPGGGNRGQRDKGRGLVLHFQDEVYQLTLILRRRVARYLE